MKKLLLVLSAMAMAGSVDAASVAVSGSAPAINRADIAMLNTSGAVADGTLWTNGPVVGQTFTTGIWRARLYAVTFQSGTPAAATKIYTLRVGTVSGTTFTQVAAESATQTVSIRLGSLRIGGIGGKPRAVFLAVLLPLLVRLFLQDN